MRYIRLDFEGIANWVASIVSQLMDAVSGIFLSALGTDMTAMEEYFPFLSKHLMLCSTLHGLCCF